MRKMSISKIKIVLVAALLAMAIACVGFMSFAKAENTFTSIDDIEITMNGYSLIVEGDDGINGLNFTISVDDDQYDAMLSEVGEGKAYASIETGVIIAPAYYNDEVAINQDSLFGAEAKYDWAEYIDGGYVYSGDKIRVININADNWVDIGSKYEYSGAIVDIREANENEAMFSVGYIKLVDSEGVESYKFSDSASISVVAAAVQEYDFLDAAQQAWVNANWFDGAITIADEGTLLADAAGAETLNVLDVISKDADLKEVLDGFDSFDGLYAVMTDASENTIEIDLANPVIALTDDMFHVWNIEVGAGSLVLYQGAIDLYNGTAKPVWNTISEDGLNSFKGFYSGADNTPVIGLKTLEASVSSVGGKASIAVTDIATWADANPSSVFYTMMPVHSKEYYELYQGKGVTMYTGFYVETKTENYTGYAVDHLAFFGQGIVSVPAANTWHGYDLPLDTIIENWDIIVNANGSYSWGARDDQAMFYNLLNTCTPSEDMVYHFTGFELAMDVTALAAKGGEILVKLDDVADKTALDLTSYMKKDDADMISSVGAINTLTYEMKGYSIADTIAVTDLTAVDVSNAKSAAYVLNVKSGDAIIYNAVIDLYNSTDAVVWADTLTAENVVIHTGGYTTGRAKPADEKAYEIIDASTVVDETDPLFGRTGTFVKTVSTTSENVIVSVLSLHSKAYYKEVVGNQNYVLTIDKYVAGSYDKDTNPGGSKLSGMGMQGAANYGRWNTWINYRGGDSALNKWGEKPGIGLYMSLDNYLLRSEDDPCYFTGAWYDFYNVHSAAAKPYNMMQFEVQVASEAEPITIYFSGAKIVEASETLLSASGLAGMTSSDEYAKLTLEYDFANEKKVDLTTVFDANNLAKYKVYASKYVSSDYFKWTITFSDGTTVVVKPLADGTTELDLDALASDGATVQSKLAANATIKVVATSPSQPYPQPTNIAIFNATVKNMPEVTPAE